MQTIYRGTQYRAAGGVRKAQSWASSLPVAIIWSARPGDPWAGGSRSEPRFLETSTIHVAQADMRNPLQLSDEPFVNLGDVLRLLRYDEPNGITEPEVRKVYNYLHNRLTGKAKGGEFLYRVLDVDGDEITDADVPFSLIMPDTVISLARDEWDNVRSSEEWAVADSLTADTFIFADAPRVQAAAVRLGYDALTYPDVFVGGEKAARVLLGEDIEDLDGIEMSYDLEDELVPTHWTLRPLTPDVIVGVTEVPTGEMLTRWEHNEAALGWY